MKTLPYACSLLLLCLSPLSANALLIVTLANDADGQTLLTLQGSGMTGDRYSGKEIGFNINDAPRRGDYIGSSAIQDLRIVLPPWQITEQLTLDSIIFDDDGTREDDLKLTFMERGGFAAGELLDFLWRTKLPIDFNGFNPGVYTDDSDANSKDLGGFRLVVQRVQSQESTPVPAPEHLVLLVLGLVCTLIARARKRAIAW
ncbi:MAG: hypothetical protein AAF512_19850 [Pseudomonadota bacterium]